MSYYSAEEMKKTLKDYPKFQKRLYCRGFLITNEKQNVNLEYPFYANWKEETIGHSFYMYTHKETYAYTFEKNQVIHFIIGHAYDPYNMLVNENEILKKLASAREKSEADYWNAESNLTGVFCVGYVTENQIVYTTDCAGMQLVYHGIIGDKLYITSHAKLVADLKGLKQPEYIERLTTNKYWHYWGTWLPGDLSPFDELKRMVPNHFGSYEKKQNSIEVVRFYPTEKIVETKTQEEYENTIHELGNIMSNTMECIAKKWPEKKVSISVTGGRDSMTALSCANKVYDKLHYFSYISNVDESVDAYAAKEILAHLGLEHELYEIPENWDGYKDLPVFKKVMECNNGCIGANNTNDLKTLWMRQASADINLPDYVISVVEPFVNANIYPLVAFIVVAVLGFITGSNWGIPAVCAPIIIPLGAACGANLLIVIAAIVCGGTFCSHACFYSDATVITSSSCGIENMEHVYSQLPYTMIAAGIASILFLIAGFIF